MSDLLRHRRGFRAEKLRALAVDHGFPQTCFIFLLTRGAIFAVFLLVGATTIEREGPDFSPDNLHPVTRFDWGAVGSNLNYTLGRGDAAWYLDLVEHGYEAGPFEATRQHNWVFYPLYPMLVRLASFGTHQYLLAGALLSNAFFFCALLLFHRLIGALGYEGSIADRAVFYAAIFPVSYFFSLPLTESLFFLAVIGSFLAGARGRWWAAGLLGACAAASRPNGILLLPALAIFYLERSERAKWGAQILWLGLIPISLGGFMFFLWHRTGNPLAFLEAQSAWGRHRGSLLAPLIDYLWSPSAMIDPWNFRLLNFAAVILALGVAVFWTSQRAWAFAALTLFSLLLPLASGSLQSMARFVLVIFPLYLALALAGRRPWLDQTIRVIFLVLFGVMTLSFALRFSFAGA
ncbi:MAG: mannosyltransferase family protein [Chthoniobacterales bacterium]